MIEAYRTLGAAAIVAVEKVPWRKRFVMGS